MYLQSLATAVPSAYYTQQDCWDLIQHSKAVEGLSERSQALLEKLLSGNNGITKRHFAVPNIETVFELDAEALNRAFEKEAPLLAQRALEKALDNAGLEASSLDALIVCTCTGYICPGISSYVGEKMGIKPDAFLQDIVGLGCGAAIPTLRSASHYLAAHPEANIACIAVEVCSAAFYLDNDPGVLISLCLFGDGAAASIWTGTRKEGSIACHSFNTVHKPEYREALRFENRLGKLRNRLHKSVPVTASSAVSELFGQRASEQIHQIISHGGGRDVIEAIKHRLPSYDLSESEQVLSQYGNMSSPSVLFALEACLDKHKALPGALWLVSFGAGFSCHSCEISSA